MPLDKRERALNKLRPVKPYGPHKREWLHWWVKTFLGIHVPNVKVCADHDAPFTAFADAFFGESSKGMSNTAFVCHGSRLFGGKTYLDGVLATTRMILLGAEIYILGGSKDQTQQMRDYLFQNSERTRGVWWDWKRAPRHLIHHGYPINDTIKLVNGGKATALAASQKETRSKHGTDLFGDEVDEMEWETLKSALGQTIARGDINPLTFLTSTWQYPDGTLTQLFEHADEKGWGVYTWCFRETHENVGGHNSQEAIDIKKSEMTTQDWITEVELQRPESGDLIFQPHIITALFDDRAYGFDEKEGNFTDILGHEYVFTPWAEGEDFYHGTDWAKTKDFTVISTMIEVPFGPDRLAAWSMHQKEPWPLMFKKHNDRVSNYGGASMFDGTGMAGQMVDDFLTVDSEPFDFARRKELHEMYSSYVAAVEAGEYVLPSIPYLKKAHENLTRGQLYESSRISKKNHTPDPVVSLALARKAQMEGNFKLLFGRAY